MKYDSVYPTFCLARQARNRLGGELRRSHLAAMPDLWMRFDHRPRTSPKAGPRCASRLDWDPSGSLHWLREDLHLSSTAFSPIHPLQFAGALSGIATALCGALFLGRSHAYTQRPESCARFFHASPLGPRTGLLPTGFFLSPPNAHPRHSMAGTWCSSGSPSRAFVLADSSSAGSLALKALRKFLHPVPRQNDERL
jgi:hypothetical protein